MLLPLTRTVTWIRRGCKRADDFLAVGFPCMLPGVLLGSGASRVLRSPAQFRAFNVAMAALLVVSLVPVLIER